MERFLSVNLDDLKKASKIAGVAISPLLLSGCSGTTKAICGIGVVGAVGIGVLLSGLNTKQSREIPLKEPDKVYPPAVFATEYVMKGKSKKERAERQKEINDIVKEGK